MERSSFRTWLGIIVVILVIVFIVHSGPAKLPGIGPLWIAANSWFKGVTGISLDQIALAIWRLIFWIVKFVLSFVWIFVQWILSLIKR